MHLDYTYDICGRLIKENRTETTTAETIETAAIDEEAEVTAIPGDVTEKAEDTGSTKAGDTEQEENADKSENGRNVNDTERIVSADGTGIEDGTDSVDGTYEIEYTYDAEGARRSKCAEAGEKTGSSEDVGDSEKTGSFISMDSYTGSIYDPASLHRYTYVKDNPVM